MKKSIKKKIIIGLCIIFGIMIIAALGASYYFGKLVTDGLFFLNEGNDTKKNSIAQLELWGYDLEAFNNTYTGDEFSVEASDGNTIPVTYFSTDGNTDKDTVILSHGNGGDHVSVYPLAEMYLRNGWNVITYDMRGHGDNESQLMTFGYLERIDMEALVDYTEEITIDKQIVVHGQSMGGASAGMYAATDHAAEYVDAVIMDSPVYSMEAMFALAWEEEDDSEGIPLSYEKLSPLVMIILQYIAAILLVLLTIWISSFFEELHEQAYYHGFRSFTAVYIIFAIYYYIQIFLDVRKQNCLLREIQAVEKQ